MKKIIPEAVLICAIVATAGYGVAQSWRQAGGDEYVPFSIASSADGKIILVAGSGSPFYSTNSTGTWTTNTQFSFGNCVATSADGTKAIGAFSGSASMVLISTNSGSSWNQTTLIGQFPACAISGDGTKLAAALILSAILTSTNSGATWQTNMLTGKQWESMAASASGNLLAVAAYGAQIYISTNWGVSWAPTNSPGNNWKSVAASADGTHLVAAGGSVYASTNSGSTWEPLSVTGTAVASSADGRDLILVNGGSPQIYTSTDYGNDWTSTNMTGKQWYSVGSSADGAELLAGENNTGVWIYRTTTSPLMNATASATNLTLSWIVPSTTFALQENSDLTTANWVTLTNVPALNLTNLNNQVSLSSTNGTGFYRLTGP